MAHSTIRCRESRVCDRSERVCDSFVHTIYLIRFLFNLFYISYSFSHLNMNIHYVLILIDKSDIQRNKFKVHVTF